MKRLLACICLFWTFSFNLGNCDLTEDSPGIKEKKIAVCYWGLTRSTKQVYPSHFECLFSVLEENNIQYDVFMHTWKLNGKQRVNWIEIDTPVDYEEYQLLKPKYYKIENQDDFTNNLDFSQYFYQSVWDQSGHSIDGEWDPLLVLNHICSLESQKRVTDMVLDSGNKYDLIMYVRPDVMFHNKLDVNLILDLQPNEMAIPNSDHHEGYNDRFAVLTYETAPVYGKRINGIIDFRREHGRIVAEKYVKYICNENHLTVRFIPLNFSLVRP